MADGAAEGDGGGDDRPVASLLEISRIVDEAARLIRQHVPRHAAPLPRRPSSTELITAPLVRAIIALRRMRRDYFPWIPGDPAWSMMLELYAARLEERRISQTTLGVVAGVAETTALRLTKSLVRQGYFTSHNDPDDRRLILLSLSDEAAEKMRAYFMEAIASGPFPP